MEHSPDTLSGPSEIIAALPGIFGFYPQESTVVVGLHASADDSGATRLGPVMRADLAHTHHILPALVDTPGGECFAFYAILISRIPDSALVKETRDMLYNFRDEEGNALIDACWHVSEVAQGTPYTIVFGPSPAQLAEAGMGRDWVSGTVASVVSSPSMRALLHNGGLPELERADTFRFFAAWDRATTGRLTVSQSEAGERGRTLARMRDDGDPQVPGIVADACSLLHEALPRPLVEPLEWQPAAEVFECALDAGELAAILSRPAFRDTLVIDALTSPQSASTALLWVAKAYRGEIRANALALWATVAVSRELNSWSVVALVCALEEVPGHSLSSMLLTMLHNGMQEELLEIARAGCAMSWETIDPACTG